MSIDDLLRIAFVSATSRTFNFDLDLLPGRSDLNDLDVSISFGFIHVVYVVLNAEVAG